MPLSAGNFGCDEQALSVALTRIDFGEGVRRVHFSCSADCYLVFDSSLDDAAEIPASARFTIPGGVVYQIPEGGPRALVAAVSGTPVASVVGYPF